MKVPVNNTFTSCTGDLVTVTGEETIGSHMDTDAAGGLHIKFSIETRGLKGVGVPSGKRYVGTNTTENEIQVPQGATEQTFESNFSLIRQGDDGTLIVGDDLRLKQLFHITVNAIGVPTAFKWEFKPDCT